MYRLYNDIRNRLGEPLWHDEQGVPRYDTFHPSLCGIYDRFVALMEIECQACEGKFLVSGSWDHSDAIRESDLAALLKRKPREGWCEHPIFPTATHSGSFGFGDAPWHGIEQCSGTTMSTSVLRIVEFWSRDGGYSGQDWRRRPEYEFVYPEGGV